MVITQQQTADSRQQAAGSRQQAAGSRQQAAGSRQQAGKRQAGSRRAGESAKKRKKRFRVDESEMYKKILPPSEKKIQQRRRTRRIFQFQSHGAQARTKKK